MNITTGLAVLSCLVAVFTAGVLTGRTIASRRHVDRLLQRELRFRDPTMPTIPVSPGSPLDAALKEAVSKHAPVRVAGGTKLGITTEEAMAGAKDLSGALRADRHSRSVDVATQFLVDRTRANGKCGAPVTTSLGPVPCLGWPGHDGLCG
jgi:hypothetical protein